MSYQIITDSELAKRNQSLLFCGGSSPAYNAVLSVVFSDEGAEPIGLQEAKDWCRIDGTDDDALVTRLISAARSICEKTANKSFIERTVTAKINNGLGNFILPYGPVVTLTSIEDMEGIAVDTDYDLKDSYDGNLTVEYDAGYTTLPEDFRTAILCQIAWMYNNRGDVKLASTLSLESSLILQQVRNV